jgi:hypothetical protein
MPACAGPKRISDQRRGRRRWIRNDGSGSGRKLGPVRPERTTGGAVMDRIKLDADKTAIQLLSSRKVEPPAERIKHDMPRPGEGSDQGWGCRGRVLDLESRQYP